MMGLGGASDSIYSPPCGSNLVISSNVDSQIAYKMPDFGYSLSTGKGHDVLQGEASIADEVFHTLPQT